jgi:hypothetical protein
LSALVLIYIHQTHCPLNLITCKTFGDYRFGAQIVLNIQCEDLVENVIGRQAIFIFLVGRKLSGRWAGNDRFRNHFTQRISVFGQGEDERFGYIF